MNIDYKKFLEHMKEQGNVQEHGTNTNLYNWGSNKLKSGDAFKATMRQDDPCDFCGRNDTSTLYIYVSSEDKVICMPCVEESPWKKGKNNAK